MSRRTFKHARKQAPNQTGFTIIELLIATTVFTVILLIITQALLYFTNSFYKGVNTSTTQNVARNIVEVVSQSIEYGASDPISNPASSTTGTYCVGSTQFDYILHSQPLDGGTVPHVLWQSPAGSGSSCSAGTFVSTGGKQELSHELMATHMRLSNFAINRVGPVNSKLWRVEITVTYGDDDLLNGPDTAAPSCKSNAGSQWCSVSTMSVTVQRRLDSNL